MLNKYCLNPTTNNSTSDELSVYLGAENQVPIEAAKLLLPPASMRSFPLGFQRAMRA